MDNFKATLNTGIGDLIISRYVLDTADVGNVSLSISKHKSCKYRGEQYYNFVSKLLPLIFNAHKYTITDCAYINYAWGDLVRLFNISPKIAKLDSLCDNSIARRGDYIVISTKARDMNLSKKYISMLFGTLKAAGVVVMLIGERKLLPCFEYSNLSNVFCIYNDIPKLPNIIDATYSTHCDIAKFKHDCSMIRNAKVAFNIGFGGNVFISTSLCNRTVNLVKPPAMWDSCYTLLRPMFNDKHVLVSDFDTAILKIKDAYDE